VNQVRLHRVAVLQPFAKFLAELGASVEGGFRRAGLPYYSLENANNYVPSQRFYSFVADAAEREHLPHLGFYVGRSLGANCADPRMIEMLAQSPALYAGLSQAAELTNKTVSRCQLGLAMSEDRRRVFFYHHPGCSQFNPARDQIAWFGLMTLLGMVRVFAGASWRPKEIGVATEGVLNHCIREQFPDTRIVKASSISYISIPMHMISQSPSISSDTASGSDKGVVEPIAGTPASNLKLIMRSYLGDAMSLDAASDLYGTSKRSLQRLLAREGTSFKRLRDEITFDVASDLLEDAGLPIADIARSLGYRHPSHFTRAFHRIAGINPRRYRKACTRKSI